MVQTSRQTDSRGKVSQAQNVGQLLGQGYTGDRRDHKDNLQNEKQGQLAHAILH